MPIFAAGGACHQRFENLLGRQSDFGGDGFGGQVVGIDLVFAQLIANAVLIEQARGVGLGGHPSIVRGWPTSAAKAASQNRRESLR